MLDWWMRLWAPATPSDEFVYWLLQTYAYLVAGTEQWNLFSTRRVVLPTREEFPTSGNRETLGDELFRMVKQHAGLSDWPCMIQCIPDEPELLNEDARLIMGQSSSKGAAGTFQVTGDGVLIRYPERALQNPAALVSTFAHELSHYVLLKMGNDPPGGEAAREPATDVCAAFLGFGVFQCNECFQFKQFTTYKSAGWQASRKGYMGEINYAYSLALFALLKDIPISSFRRYLKPNPSWYVKYAAWDLRRKFGTKLPELQAAASARTEVKVSR